MVTNKDNFCVIMGGGIGSRFWPFSRKTLPKQFLDFFGTGRSLLQQTFDRFKQVIPMENILIVTNDLYADLVKEQLPELKPEQILLEPTRRNTAPCIAWASYHIRALNPNANIVVAPSDHLILKEGEFLAAIEKGLDFVSQSDNLLTLGIKPNRRGKFPRPVKYLSETVSLFRQTSLPDSRHGIACGLFVHAQQYRLGQAFRPPHLLCGGEHLHLAAQMGGCEDNDGIADKVRYAFFLLFSFHCSVPLIRFELVFIDLDLLPALADAYQPGVLEPFQQLYTAIALVGHFQRCNVSRFHVRRVFQTGHGNGIRLSGCRSAVLI